MKKDLSPPPYLFVATDSELWQKLRPLVTCLVPDELARIIPVLSSNSNADSATDQTVEFAQHFNQLKRTSGLILLGSASLQGTVPWPSCLRPLLNTVPQQCVRKIVVGHHTDEAIGLPSTTPVEVIITVIRLTAQNLRLEWRLSQRGRELRKIRSAAYRDPLTASLNRRAWARIFSRVYRQAQRYHRQIVFALFDLDQFKAVNDALGHAEGDRILRDLARRVPQSCRKKDWIFRWGGDEFAFLFLTDPHVDPHPIVERVRRQFAHVIPQLGGMTLTASAGYSNWIPSSGEQNWNTVATALLEKADTALRLAKAAGGNISLGNASEPS